MKRNTQDGCSFCKKEDSVMKMKSKSVPFDLLLVLIFSTVAIELHAIMLSPGAEMDDMLFDSCLVRTLGVSGSCKRILYWAVSSHSNHSQGICLKISP